MLKKILFFTAWLFLLCLVLLFCFAIGIWLNWSTVTIFMIWAGILIAGILLWKAGLWLTLFIAQRKIYRFFQKFRLSRHEYVLFRYWKTGASVVQRIQRKRPVVPWYILLGSRCGKTSLLAGAGLPMFSNDAEDSDVVPTNTLRWWFFRNVCILDLSSNFLNGVSSFNRAWTKLVGWISRAPMPAGVIVALSISDLMNEDVSSLHDKARKIRAQTESLMRKMKRQLPFYILVTQCDKFEDFSPWAQQLSTEQRQQALGYYWETPPDIDSQDVSALLPLFAMLKKGLGLARISMAETQASPEVVTALLNFPESISTLQRPLHAFLASLCEPNAYFIPTCLGGVWFTASEQLGNNKSRLTSYFIQDLLTHNLPAFSASREVVWQYSKKLRVGLVNLLLLICMVALSFSAVRSTALMQKNIASSTPSELVVLLVKNESHQDNPLLYLPFSPVLNHQHKQIEQLLITKLSPQLRDVSLLAEEYRQQFLRVSPEAQRKMILALAQSIIIRRSMRDGATLEALNQETAIPDTLRLSSFESGASTLVQLALERWMVQQPAGPDALAALRHLLLSLVNYEPTLAWLVAPVDFPAEVRASDFWPDPQSDRVLTGIWTQRGVEQLNEWVGLINQAEGSAQQEAVLTHFLQTLPARRQDAWRDFLVGVMPLFQNTVPRSLSSGQLISIGQGLSPAMKFARNVVDELDDIPERSSQVWLSELRRLQILSTQTAGIQTFNKVQQTNARLRNILTTLLYGRMLPVPSDPIVSQTDAWLKWTSSLNAVVNQALNQVVPSSILTQGLFTMEADASARNPLSTLYVRFEQLRKRLTPDNEDVGVNAVWALYQSDANSLLAHAMARTGCWLNDQWQTKVMWPMRKDATTQDYDARQSLGWQYIADFVRNSAKGLLIMTKQGPQAGEFHGQTLPFNDAFLRTARHMLDTEDILDVPLRQSTQAGDQISLLSDKITKLTQEQKELEVKSYRISIISAPATVPEGARLIPIGSSLILECQNGTQVLDSMNFMEQVEFNWQPGICQDVKLNVKFPGFTATYHYAGNSAWPDFLKQFASGEALFDASDFEGSVIFLKDLNIKHLLVRLKVTDPRFLESAWAEWKSIDEKLVSLKAQQQTLIGQQPSKLPSAALRGRFSELPKDVADCR